MESYSFPPGRTAVGVPDCANGCLRRPARTHEHLVIETGAFATRVLFSQGRGRASRARSRGCDRAASLSSQSAFRPKLRRTQAVLREERKSSCAGAPSTRPQLLMLSGIGEAQQLKDKGIDGLYAADGSKVDDVVHLPGVGKNLQDRYEVSVISEVEKDFSDPQRDLFRPNDQKDPACGEWRRKRAGLYATNGGALAFLLRFGSTDPDRARTGSVHLRLPRRFPRLLLGTGRRSC